MEAASQESMDAQSQHHYYSSLLMVIVPSIPFSFCNELSDVLDVATIQPLFEKHNARDALSAFPRDFHLPQEFIGSFLGFIVKMICTDEQLVSDEVWQLDVALFIQFNLLDLLGRLCAFNQSLLELFVVEGIVMVLVGVIGVLAGDLFLLVELVERVDLVEGGVMLYVLWSTWP